MLNSQTFWGTFRRNREFVEGFENSSFTRPSGGAFEVKLAKIQKKKKGFVEVYLSFIVRNRISSLIKMDQRANEGAMDDGSDASTVK